MKTKVLGTGGVLPIPKVGCKCFVCEEARSKGIPYSRTNTCYFLEDINLLFDTPEDIRTQLEREKIFDIDHVLLTHWHPDHTNGVRILEQYNYDFAEGRPVGKPVTLYMSQEQHELFRKFSCGSFLDYYQKKGIINISYFSSHEVIKHKNISITPILIEHTRGFYFLITEGNKKIVYAPCEYHKLKVDPIVRDIDVFLVHNLFWEDKAVSLRKNPPLDEDSFEQMLEHAKEMKAKRIVLTHIEESFKLGHDQLNQVLQEKYAIHNVEAGYDGMRLDL